MKKKIIVLISGRGSNLLALIKKAENYQITAIYSDQEDAAGLKYGEEFNIPTFVFDRKNYQTKAEQKKALYQDIEKNNPDLIILAGFMSIVPAYFTSAHPQKIINTHPSLLPKYPGLNSYQEVLAAGDTIHGCTIHYVDAGIDTGEIIEQGECAITQDETVDSLKQKVQALEHQLFPEVINRLCR